jgi:maltose O-acetyltransferase
MQSLYRKIKLNALFFLYVAIAKRLPCSYARWGGQTYKKIRRVLARPMLATCGEGVNIETGAVFGRGNRVWLGKFSDLGINCEIHGEVHIGDYTFMGPSVAIWTTNHAFNRTDIPMMYQGQQPERPVFIGDDVWIGTRVTILPGVNVGNHAIIGAGSVVTRNVPNWAIVAGNPARVIKYRVPDPGQRPDQATTNSSVKVPKPNE